MTLWQIVPTVMSILSTVIIALVGWGYRSDRAAIKKEIEQNSKDIAKNAQSIEKVASRYDDRMNKIEGNFNDLKSGMPLVYVLREDYVAQMNRFEDKLNQLLYTKGGTRANE